jgi:hypothetical protein
MKTRTICLAVLVSLVAARSVTADAPPAQLPFKLGQGYLVIVRGLIADIGVNFLVDTGSVPSIVDWRVARKLRLHKDALTLIAFGGKSRIGSATVSDIRVGPIHMREVPVGVGDLTFLGPPRIDAILGMDVLGRATALSIDYDARTLRFESDAESDGSVPMELVWPFQTVTLEINRQFVTLIVDTGSPDLILFRRRIKDRFPRFSIVGSKTLYLISGELLLDRVRLPNVVAGARSLNWLTGFVSSAPTEGYPTQIDGVLGVRALGVRRLALDFAVRTMNWRD